MRATVKRRRARVNRVAHAEKDNLSISASQSFTSGHINTKRREHYLGETRGSVFATSNTI